VVLAILILAGVILSVSGWRVSASDPALVVAGAASGVMGTITSSGAAPYAIVMQRVPPAEVRGTMGCVFFAGGLLSLVTLGIFGQFIELANFPANHRRAAWHLQFCNVIREVESIFSSGRFRSVERQQPPAD